MRKTKEIKSQLLDFQIRALVKDEKNGYMSQRTYKDLKEIPVDGGLQQKIVDEEYPITPDYVNSFADSANYKSNLSQALSNSPTGKYADIRDIQEFAKLDTSEQIRRVQESKATLSRMEELLSSKKYVQVQDKQEGGATNENK